MALAGSTTWRGKNHREGELLNEPLRQTKAVLAWIPSDGTNTLPAVDPAGCLDLYGEKR